MNKDSHIIFENYVDGITQRKNQLAGNIMDIVKYGIPTKEEFIKIRQELNNLVNNRLKLGGKATDEEQNLFNELIGKVRSYRSQHPDDPPGLYPQNKEENAEETCIEDLAKKFGVELERVQKELQLGISTETEHTKDIDVAKKIALDHLNEDPLYYSKLLKMEKGEDDEEEGDLMVHMKQKGMIPKDSKVTLPKHNTEENEMPTKQFMSLKQFINKGPLKIKTPSKELRSAHPKIHDLAKQDSREGQREESAENSNTNMIVSHFRKTFGPGEKERMIKNNIDPYEFFVDYHSWMKHYDPKILSNFAEIYNSQYPDHKVDTKKLLNMFQAIKDVPLKGYQAPGKKSENEERRIDPKCWKGYHKSGTKLKDGVRVNNCVKNS